MKALLFALLVACTDDNWPPHDLAVAICDACNPTTECVEWVTCELETAPRHVSDEAIDACITALESWTCDEARPVECAFVPPTSGECGGAS